MKKIARFIYDGIEVIIFNIDPSNSTVFIDKPWHKITQEIFDQLDDSNKFSSEQLNILAEMNIKDFLKCIHEKDENNVSYNRARAIYEYEQELNYAIKNNLPTKIWSDGLNDLMQGAIAEKYNY